MVSTAETPPVRTAAPSRRRAGYERALVLAARRGGQRERNELVDFFLAEIGAIAREYRSVRTVSREELMQAGVLGLLKALERYDPARANRFWTYARWWVRQAMQELVSSLGGASGAASGSTARNGHCTASPPNCA